MAKKKNTRQPSVEDGEQAETIETKVAFVSAKTGGISRDGQILSFHRGDPIADGDLERWLRSQGWPLMSAERWAVINGDQEE
jgi:hypothetical protein